MKQNLRTDTIGEIWSSKETCFEMCQKKKGHTLYNMILVLNYVSSSTSRRRRGSTTSVARVTWYARFRGYQRMFHLRILKLDIFTTPHPRFNVGRCLMRRSVIQWRPRLDLHVFTFFWKYPMFQLFEKSLARLQHLQREGGFVSFPASRIDYLWLFP